MSDWLDHALGPSPAPPRAESLPDWWSAVFPSVDAWTEPADRAIAAGLLADRVGYAFAAGYRAALARLVPDLPPSGLASFCATEEGGAHPRAIRTLVEDDGDGFRVRGSKRWSTCAPVAETLLVVASRGRTDSAGRNELVLVRVEAAAPGVVIRTMPATPFAPEVPHAELDLDVCVNAAAVLPGDGYADYLKPFRTIEDIHVQAALVAYVLGAAHRAHWPEAAREALVASLVSLRALGSADPKSAAVHVAVAGVLDQVGRTLEGVAEHWQLVDSAERERWERDRGLGGVASKAREARRTRAWEQLSHLGGRAGA